MASMIRVGNTFVNLDRITHVLTGFKMASVYFSAEEEDWVSFKGLEAMALVAYLDGASSDVVSLHLEAGTEGHSETPYEIPASEDTIWEAEQAYDPVHERHLALTRRVPAL
jgi:hypothetical protein